MGVCCPMVSDEADVATSCMGWLIVIDVADESSFELAFSGVVVIVGVPDEFTRENCLNTWDSDELAVWWCGNMGTACCMLCWNVWVVFMGEDVIEMICELLFPAALAFANRVFTVWFDVLMLVVVGNEEEAAEEDACDWLVKFAIVVETTWGLVWTVAELMFIPVEEADIQNYIKFSCIKLNLLRFVANEETFWMWNVAKS